MSSGNTPARVPPIYVSVSSIHCITPMDVEADAIGISLQVGKAPPSRYRLTSEQALILAHGLLGSVLEGYLSRVHSARSADTPSDLNETPSFGVNVASAAASSAAATGE